MPGFVPTDEQRDCNRSPPTQVPLRFAVLPEATAVPRWHRSLCLIPIIGRANCGLLILGVQSRSELDRIVFESIGFSCPGFTDGFERREPIQSLETLGEVVGVEECLDVLAKLVVAVVVVAPNGRLFESTVHPLDLPVRPRMIWLCQLMLNLVRSTEQNEHIGLPSLSRTLTVLWQITELDAVVGEYGVNFVGDDCDHGLQQGRCRISVSLLVELRESKLRCAVNRDKQVKFAFFSAHFSDIDVEVADRVPLERLLAPRLAFDRRKPADLVA